MEIKYVNCSLTEFQKQAFHFSRKPAMETQLLPLLVWDRHKHLAFTWNELHLIHGCQAIFPRYPLGRSGGGVTLNFLRAPGEAHSSGLCREANVRADLSTERAKGEGRLPIETFPFLPVGFSFTFYIYCRAEDQRFISGVMNKSIYFCRNSSSSTQDCE